MDQQNLNRENLSPSGNCGTGVPQCPELSADEGAWLKIEDDTISPSVFKKICKKTLVSLYVTLEGSEHECSLVPYCRNHPIQKCLKDQEQAEGKNNVF
jgi:hypothetical protein